jgi:hypothetical protein
MGYGNCNENCLIEGVKYEGYFPKMKSRINNCYYNILIGDSEALGKESVSLKIGGERSLNYPFLTELNIRLFFELENFTQMIWDGFEIWQKMDLRVTMRAALFYTENYDKYLGRWN